MNNILIFPGWFPNKTSPLNAIFTKKHVDVISKTNNVKVVYAQKNNFQTKRYEITIDKSCSYPIVICYYRGSDIFFFRKFINFYRSIMAILKAIKATDMPLSDFDFVHIHVITVQSILPLIFKVLKNKPYLISEHSTFYIRNNSLNFFDRFFRNVLAKYSSGLSAVSNSLKEAMIKNGLNHENFPVLQNSINQSLFFCSKIEENQTHKFLHVSRLEESAKNVIGIVRAFSKLNNKYKDAELHIVGGQPNIVSDVEIFVKSHLKSSKIFFHGIQLGSQIVPFYQNANYLVMFSNYETQAVVILEALNCGIPVIATNLPALKEYLHHGNSIMIEPQNEEELFVAMENCYKNEVNFWLPTRIASDIKLRYNDDKLAIDFNDFYLKGLIH